MPTLSRRSVCAKLLEWCLVAAAGAQLARIQSHDDGCVACMPCHASSLFAHDVPNPSNMTAAKALEAAVPTLTVKAVKIARFEEVATAEPVQSKREAAVDVLTAPCVPCHPFPLLAHDMPNPPNMSPAFFRGPGGALEHPSPPMPSVLVTAAKALKAAVPTLAVKAGLKAAAEPPQPEREAAVNILTGRVYPHHPAILYSSVVADPDVMDAGILTELNGLHVPAAFDCDMFYVHPAASGNTFWPGQGHHYFYEAPSRWYACWQHYAAIKSGAPPCSLIMRNPQRACDMQARYEFTSSLGRLAIALHRAAGSFSPTATR